MAKAKACDDHEDSTAGCAECEALALLAESTRPKAPDMAMSDADVENTEFDYSVRAPEDWVSSGPLGANGHGKGREFPTWPAAEAWARDFYGARFKGRKADEPNSGGRWAFIIRGPRGATGPVGTRDAGSDSPERLMAGISHVDSTGRGYE